jgi:hypothetical protein
VAHEDEDEEAFRWAGDEVGGREGARLPIKDQDAMAGVDADLAPAEPVLRSGGLGTALTVLFGAGYLALTVGWILATGYTSSGSTSVLIDILWQFAEFTAIVAAPLWFGATVLLTRGSRPLVRDGWLLLGLGILLPWPLLPLLVTA